MIFFWSTRPTAGVITSDPIAHFYIFKSFHLIEYAVLSILLYLGFTRIRQTIIVGYFYSLSDEIHQHFVAGRTSMIRDTLIDLLGIVLGLIVVQIIFRRLATKDN